MSQLDPITIQELAAVKQEIFCGETKIKKSMAYVAYALALLITFCLYRKA